MQCILRRILRCGAVRCGAARRGASVPAFTHASEGACRRACTRAHLHVCACVRACLHTQRRRDSGDARLRQPAHIYACVYAHSCSSAVLLGHHAVHQYSAVAVPLRCHSSADAVRCHSSADAVRCRAVPCRALPCAAYCLRCVACIVACIVSPVFPCMRACVRACAHARTHVRSVHVRARVLHHVVWPYESCHTLLCVACVRVHVWSVTFSQVMSTAGRVLSIRCCADGDVPAVRMHAVGVLRTFRTLRACAVRVAFVPCMVSGGWRGDGRGGGQPAGTIEHRRADELTSSLGHVSMGREWCAVL